MAIDLPPALPPQLTIPATIVEASQNEGAYIRRVGDFALQLSGAHHLSTAELDQIFSQASTPSEAIVLMNAWTHRRGYLLVQYIYSRPINGVIHVRAIQKEVGEISGDSAIVNYFKARENDSSPTRSEFVLDGTFANLISDRTGIDYSISYREQEKNRDTLDLFVAGTPAEQYSRWHGSLQLGNQGSRFAGRYFATAALSRDFSSGTRVSAAYQTAIPELGEVGDGDDFSHSQLAVSQPTRFGLYEVDVQQTQYERRLTTTSESLPGCDLPLLLDQCLQQSSQSPNGEFDFSADIHQLAVRGQQMLKADIDHRWLFAQQLQWVDSTLEQASGESIQDERYATLELGTSYQRAQFFDEKTLKWKLAVSVRGGLGGNSGTLASDKNTAGVSTGKRSAEFILLKPNASFAYQFHPNYQLTAALIGQVADEQLPQQQQWVLGGVDRMSAYLPGVLVGDTGYHLDLSFNRTWELGVFSLAGGVFAEYGSAQYENASGSHGTADLGSDSSIADAGIRATLTAWDWLEVRAVIAESIADDNVDKAVLERAEADFFVVVKAIF